MFKKPWTPGPAGWPQYLVFNIRGNRYRLIVAADFARKTFWVKHFMTHADYDRWTPAQEES